MGSSSAAKEAKGHGTGKLVEGLARTWLDRGDCRRCGRHHGRLVLQAVAAVEVMGCRVARVIAVLDRLEARPRALRPAESTSERS
ncbi:MAG: hypothetical protein U0794_20390 [Isosphaeraceae bacterium]